MDMFSRLLQQVPVHLKKLTATSEQENLSNHPGYTHAHHFLERQTTRNQRFFHVVCLKNAYLAHGHGWNRGVPHHGCSRFPISRNFRHHRWPSDLDKLSGQDPSDVQVLGVGLKGLVVPQFPSATRSHWGWRTQSTPHKSSNSAGELRNLQKLGILMWFNTVQPPLFLIFPCRISWAWDNK